ncbi:hypothetical protein D3C80_2217600 [compost metagenome]
MGRTVRLAALTAQAHVQRIFDLRAVPLILNNFTLEQFEKQARSPSCRVTLFACRTKTRTHGSAF